MSENARSNPPEYPERSPQEHEHADDRDVGLCSGPFEFAHQDAPGVRREHRPGEGDESIFHVPIADRRDDREDENQEGKQRDERVICDRAGHERDALCAHLVNDRASDREHPFEPRTGIEVIEPRSHTACPLPSVESRPGPSPELPASERDRSS